jgi:hypothetical protein
MVSEAYRMSRPMLSTMNSLPKPSWAAITGGVFAAVLIVAWLLRPDQWFALVGGVVLILVAMTLPRLKDIEGTVKGFKATMYQREIVEAVVSKIEAPRVGGEVTTQPSSEHESAPPASPATPATARPEPVRHISRQGQLKAIPLRGWPKLSTTRAQREEWARFLRPYSTNEFADALVNIVREGDQVPPLRALSADRVRLEQDLFGAILEYQTEVARSPNAVVAGSEYTLQQEIQRFWTRPESLSDEETADLAQRVRNWTKRRSEGPTSQRLSPEI